MYRGSNTYFYCTVALTHVYTLQGNEAIGDLVKSISGMIILLQMLKWQLGGGHLPVKVKWFDQIPKLFSSDSIKYLTVLVKRKPEPVSIRHYLSIKISSDLINP